jgi:hypothetical protein
MIIFDAGIADGPTEYRSADANCGVRSHETIIVCALCILRRGPLARHAVGGSGVGERRVRARKRSFSGFSYKQPLNGNYPTSSAIQRV